MTERVLDTFSLNVLRCVLENYRTGEEIWRLYIKKYPPHFDTIQKKLGIAVQANRIDRVLKILHDEGLVEKSSTKYTDQVLDKETVVYRISDKGRVFRLSKKK